MKPRFDRLQLAAGAALAASFVAVPAHADVHFNGFGQVVVGSTLDNDKAFPNLGYDADASFNPESLFALQANAPLGDKFSATVQVEARGIDDFEPKFSWAYVSYQLDSDWSIKLGRQRAPLFYYSDYLDVGVAYPWIRTPPSVYGGVGTFSNIDAVSINYSTSYGDWQFDPQLLYGRYNGTTHVDSGDVGIELRNFVSVSLHATYDDWLTLRASYLMNSMSLDIAQLNPLLDGLRAAGESDVADDLAADGDRATFTSVAFEINRANWLVVGEHISQSAHNTSIGKWRNWYLAAGYHVGKFLPMFTYGHRDESPDTDALRDLSPDSPAYAMLYPGVAATVNGVNNSSSYYEFGLRYDLAPNIALKADYTRYDPKDAPSTDLVSAALAFTF